MDAQKQDMIRQRAGCRCEYCHLPDDASALPFHVEHIIAVVHEPNHHETNLAWSCPQCNWHKGPNLTTLDPDSGAKIDLFNPRTETWNDHFAMEEYVLIGLTPQGRGTAKLLKMNLPRRIEVRQQMM